MNTKFILNICTLLLSMALCMIPFSLDAKKNNVSCQQMHDVIDEHGQRFMQFVFSSPNDKYTVGYVESYDDPSKGSFFCYLHPIVVQNQNVISMQQLQQSHSLSVTNMKQRALANSPITQRQQIDILVASGRMSVDQAMMHYQQIEYAPAIEQAKKQAKYIRKQDKKKKNKLKHVQESKNNTSSPVVQNKSYQVKAPQTPTTNHPSTAQNQLTQELKNIQTQQSTKHYQDKTDTFQNVMEQRSQALQASITYQKNTHEYHAINSLTAGFLQAQGIDILPFTQGQGLPIQHQITGELVNILDAVAQLTENNFSIPHNSLAQYCAQLASLTQQANQQADLQQAMNGADCCHGLQHYLQGMVAGIGQAYQQFQTALDYFDTIADHYGTLIARKIVASKQSVIDGSITQILEDVTSSTMTNQTRFMQSIHDYTPMHQLRDIIQREIAQESQKILVPTDLTLPISDVKFAQLKELSSQLRQLQDLAKYTNNFTNVENLIIEDICYLNRIYELQTYRTQIKNFLETHKPYFIHDGIIYPIEDIASYHIHAGDYYRKDPPKGGHSNPHGNNLDYFQPTINKQNSLGAKEMRFYNSRNKNKIKDSSIYPETWSEYNCDLKAINLLQSQHVEITERTRGTLTCIGKTSEDLDIIVHYDIAHKRIKSHYPNSEKF